MSYAHETFSVYGCEVLVAYGAENQTVVVRGTKGIVDLVRDIRVLPWFDFDCGWCHSGFLKGGKKISDELDKYIDKSKPVIFTGHSLGGAMSLIVAIKMHKKGYKVQGWTGFASPKLFLLKGRKFKFPVKNFRYEGDIIPMCPSMYSHDYDTIQLGNDRFPNIIDHDIENYIRALE